MKLSLHVPSQPHTRSGVYVGGIGAGGFEVRPDGRFHCCQIFNQWHPWSNLDAFFVHNNGKDLRGLMTPDMLPTGERIAGVNDVQYTGEFPKVSVRFPSRDVEVSFTSFFIPGDVKNSSIPAALMRVKGTGKLLFMLRGKYDACPVSRGGSVTLKSKEGEIGLHSQKANASGVRADERWRAVTGLEIEHHQGLHRIKPGKPAPCYATLQWEGTFDDEVLIAWHYPDSRDKEGNYLGHAYTNHFKSLSSVVTYVNKKRTWLKAKSNAFHKSIFGSAMPSYLKESYSAQISTFTKSSWHAEDGRFGVWEGSCCCCGVQTTDVSYYGSWLYVKMFPELEESGIRLTKKFQRKEDGWIPHLFPGTFKRIDVYGRKDMNMQYVLMVYRDYALWKDKKFLKDMYPSVKKAIVGAYAWDSDGDLIPEVEPAAQTFDAWGFYGCTLFIATLWLATLKAGAKAAEAMGDKANARKWAADAKIVRENIVKKFWNGKYFILAVNEKGSDEGCMLDGLSGDWYSRLLGLGGILDDKMVVSHLKSCIRYCRKKSDTLKMPEYATAGEEGYCYINAGYKDNRRVCFQQYEPWTGIEFTFAVHLLLLGLKKEALQVIKDVHERKERCGMVWNHIECGGDYFRPMVIGAFWDLLKKKR